MFIHQRQTRGPENRRPADIDLKLRIQEEREFAISKALNEGRGYQIFEINNLPDEHFQKIIEEKDKNKQKFK